jgi:hypothetical protein
MWPNFAIFGGQIFVGVGAVGLSNLVSLESKDLTK